MHTSSKSLFQCRSRTPFVSLKSRVVQHVQKKTSPGGNSSTRRTHPLVVSASIKPEKVDSGSVSFVLLAGGVGKRMGSNMPKQYIPLRGQEIALWSLDIISALDEVGEVVVVCDPSYEDVFTGAQDKGLCHGKPLTFAAPGAAVSYTHLTLPTILLV